MIKSLIAFLVAGNFATSTVPASNVEDYASLVNPFIGTTNFGATNPGALCPNGMMAVVPFNVMGSDGNLYDKDARWWSTPYEKYNCFFTGFAHGALSGVGCPDLASLLSIATTGELEVDYHKYGTRYSDEKASGIDGASAKAGDRLRVTLGGRRLGSYRITHRELVEGRELVFRK